MARTSGVDFYGGDSPYEQHPDLHKPNDDAKATNLFRNKDERRRLQGLILSSKKTVAHTPFRPRNLRQRIELWMINRGAKRLFLVIWILLHLLVVIFGLVQYQTADQFESARRTFGLSYAIARTAALVLHVNIIFILLPVCRNLISSLRRTALKHFVPFDEAIKLHMLIGWTMVLGVAIHALAHLVNFGKLAAAIPDLSAGQRLSAFLSINFLSGPGATGWVMVILLGIMVAYSSEFKRKTNYEAFWYTHHLFIVLFVIWQLHGMFCMIKPDRPPYCSSNSVGVFWRFWLVGGLIWAAERVLREVRSRHRTYISKVIQHPSNVLELQIKKDKTKARAGQYIFLSCPEISYFQWHPFTLTSAPEEDYLSVHVRIVGNFTRQLAKVVGCSESDACDEQIGAGGAAQTLDHTLPRVMIDGPFGGASEDFLNFETVMLIGTGIGVTPFASILKSIWYRMNNLHFSKPTRLSKVYFTWVVRDYESTEWFHSLLHAIEEQDSFNKIEINIYLTGPVKVDDIDNIMVQDVGAEKDAITSLRAPTLYGRPRWELIFGAMAEKHAGSDIGVLFCGNRDLATQLETYCNTFSEPTARGARFFFKKDSFEL